MCLYNNAVNEEDKFELGNQLECLYEYIDEKGKMYFEELKKYENINYNLMDEFNKWKKLKASEELKQIKQQVQDKHIDAYRVLEKIDIWKDFISFLECNEEFDSKSKYENLLIIITEIPERILYKK